MAMLGPANFDTPFKNALRTAVSRYRAGGVFEAETNPGSSITYSGAGGADWTNVGNNFEIMSGSGYRNTGVNGATYTITTPADFPGGTVAVGIAFNAGNLATHTWTVNGSAAGSVSGTGQYASGRFIVHTKRFTGLAAGTNTIVGTVSGITGSAILDFWQIEAANPPAVLLPLANRFYNYSLYGAPTAPWTYLPTDTDRTQIDNAITAIKNEFDSSVITVDTDSVLTKSQQNFMADGAHLNPLGNSKLAAQMYKALATAPITVDQAAYGSANVNVTNFDDIVFRNTNNHTNAFQIQGYGGPGLTGTTLFNVDTLNDRIGIGTASPSERLHVQGGNIRLESGAATTPTAIIFARTAALDGTLGVAGVADNYLTGSVAGDVVLRSTNGKVIVGNSNTTAGVLVRNNLNSTTAFQVQNAAANALLTADTSNMKVTIQDSAAGVGGNGNLLEVKSGNGSVTYLAVKTGDSTGSFVGGQTGMVQNFNVGGSTAGTTRGYQYNSTITNATNATTNIGHEFNMTDNATTLANTNTGLKVTMSGSNTSQLQVGANLSVNRGVGLIATTSGAPGASWTCGPSTGVMIIAACIADTSASTNLGAGLYASTNSTTSSLSNLASYGFSFGAMAVNGEASSSTTTAGVSFAGVKGSGFSSGASGAYNAVGVLGVAAASSSAASVYGGYFTIADSLNVAPAGAALFASTGSISAAGSGNGRNAVNVLQATGGAGQAVSAITGVTGGTGSAISLVSGNGGAATGASGANFGGAGGTVVIQGGNGGNVTSATGTSGAGGNITLSAGSAGTGGTAGTAGTVLVKNQSNSTTAFQIQNAAGTTIMGIDTVNSKIFSGIADGATAIGFTFNTPAYTTAGAKLISIQNNGAERFAIDRNGHIITGGAGAPSTAVAAGLGTTGTCSVSGNDTAGQITLVSSGTGQAGGLLCTLTWNTAFAASPRTVITSGDAVSPSKQAYVGSGTTTVTINFAVAPTAGQTYFLNYFNPQ
jgi:hypothetical protein